MTRSDKLQVKRISKELKVVGGLNLSMLAEKVNPAQEITENVFISITTAGGATYKETLPTY